MQHLDYAEHVLGTRIFSVVPSILPLPALGFAALALAGKLLGGGRWEDLQTVLRGLPNNVTTEMDLELWRLAQAIKNDGGSRAAVTDRAPAELAEDFRAGQLPAVLQSGVARFMGQYGHRAVAEIDVGMPRWSDDATHILGVLANYLRLEGSALAPDIQFSNAAEEAEACVDRLVAEARSRGRLRGTVVRAALRRADYALELERRHVPRVLLSDGTEPEAVPSGDAAAASTVPGALTGSPASAGVVTATARVILDPVGARLEPGEILVAPSTDPGWTPLFLTAGGLVMEMGGPNSHGAVVAREYGIPAVVGVPDATLRLSTGQEKTVDGGAGTVVPS
ncbi:hypothetical protein FYJ92_02055 [Pseudarthrobacter sp. NBSH8]|nr:hypothetical protein FYJ92_02055 [Pseudarthrobacter sp. NBSH8]